MPWRIEVERSAQRELERLDRPVRARILRFLSERLAPVDDPRSLGQALKGSALGDLWKYRVGDYRVVAAIQDAVLVVIVVRVGHRRDVYRR